MATNLTVTLQKTQTEFQALRKDTSKRSVVKVIFRNGVNQEIPGVELQIDDEEPILILAEVFERVVNLYAAQSRMPEIYIGYEITKEDLERLADK